MRCGYCDEVFDDATPHYCVAGRNWIVADNKCLRAEVERLRAIVREYRADHDRTYHQGRACEFPTCQQADKEAPRG